MHKLEALFWGILAALAALVIEFIILIIHQSITVQTPAVGLTYGISLAVFVEEFFKYTVIWKISLKEKSVTTVFLNAFLVGVGFSLIEIALNILNRPDSWRTLFPAYLGLFLIHTATASILGYYFASQKKRLLKNNILVFLLIIFWHFCFNLAVMYKISYLAIYFVLLALLALLFLSFFKLKNSSLRSL